MRFHIGFSKFIKPKKLIEWLGLIFVGLLAFIGIYNHEVLAWTDLNSNYMYSFTSVDEYDRQNNYNLVTTDLYTCKNTANTSNYRYMPSKTENNLTGCLGDYFYLATTEGTNHRYLLDKFVVNIDAVYSVSTNCSTADDSKQSVDLKFFIQHIVTDAQRTSYASLFLLDPDYPQFYKNTLGFRISAITEVNNEEVALTTNCNMIPGSYLNNGYSYTNRDYAIECNNVFSGSADYPLKRLEMEVMNIIPFNNRYNSTTESGQLGSNSFLFIQGKNTSTRQQYPTQYQCNSEPPVINGGGWPSEDPNGLNDIWVDMQDNFDTSIPGIDTSSFIVALPTTFTDLLTMPLDIVNAVVQGSTGTCSNYNIDMSSIVHKWGNPNDSYVLSIPCMRNVLSSKLGTIFTLIDSLLAFYVFYNITMIMIQLINAILSGQDLFEFYFQPTHRKTALVDSATGEVVGRA